MKKIGLLLAIIGLSLWGADAHAGSNFELVHVSSASSGCAVLISTAQTTQMQPDAAAERLSTYNAIQLDLTASTHTLHCRLSSESIEVSTDTANSVSNLGDSVAGSAIHWFPATNAFPLYCKPQDAAPDEYIG